MTAVAGRDQNGAGAIVPFSADYAAPDEELAAQLVAGAAQASAAEERIDARAIRLIAAIRAHSGGLGGIEDFLHVYSLSTKEGLALMVLAEALLRVPDTATADRLIEDKLAAGDWLHHERQSTALLVSASAWALGLTARIIQPGETPDHIFENLVKRLGAPAVRMAIRQAMRLFGSHFVLAQTIDDAIERARAHQELRYSFDMLGEGARTSEDAARYFESYAAAIGAIGRSSGNHPLPARPGISVKLSALHPRYEAFSRERVLRELAPRVLELARSAREFDLNFTVDAEEADRLELSLDVVAAVVSDTTLAGWDGFGLAVQTYQKRAPQVIDWIAGTARALNRRLMVRLVKGAYWDTEIKRAQERGLADYPVFTRKAMTDLCYLACARKLLAVRRRIYPQFATHNALTVASIIEDAGGIAGFEFQRLHGMGEVLYQVLREEFPDLGCGVYAPVGGHRDLLAYLVRRLLENGANTSFVSRVLDPAVPVASLIRRPQSLLGAAANARHPRIPRPGDLYRPGRRNSEGVEFGHRATVEALLAQIRSGSAQAEAGPLIDGVVVAGRPRLVHSPINDAVVGTVAEADEAIVRSAMAAAEAGFPGWNATSVESRASALDRTADLVESNRARLIALLQAEGGKTLEDSLSEVREAADFCRYYAMQARDSLIPQSMPGPTGEANELRYRGRGIFVCISPWNFPAAIFTGQIAAALVAGNVAIAKPAEQTPLIAAELIRLLHAGGIPVSALHLVPGDGAIGAMLVSDPRVGGVVFTGSTEVARRINRTLAERSGPIVPLIAETGGINAMIVDATALPEQVTDDVIASAFRSAGQRCSALRLLCLQEEVAEPILAMIIGAAQELKLGDPREVSTHIGPIIDANAKRKLNSWIATMQAAGALRFRWDASRPMPASGTYVPPVIIELANARELTQEIFGPVLHVVRWRADRLDELLDDIAANGYALTLGIASRIDATIGQIAARLSHGNIYVNRNMIGAVVGTQPFGGSGLSGTGPKAGGANYLRRFTLEQVVTVNTAAAGGNPALLTEGE
jgi:RHH-type transcriptional regulator, proline utilization regulon repressor / proline dehydrogenase / delta 1-pyrroline-5-carboxylate dehydrogenase